MGEGISPPTPAPWIPPTTTRPLAQRVGSSILDDFVAGHSAADCLREIVQNEFDGGGSTIEIAFGENELTVTGSGRPITAGGWSRLSVIAGTGTVIGGEAGDTVEAKANGIGSKNFGIRSLFLFGDRIHVRSNGRVALLDFELMGTENLPDPSSAGHRGVSIHIPYRTSRTRTLEPFTVERERLAMSQIADALLPTLVKLAGAGQSSGIRSLSVRSARTGRRLEWRQSAKIERCRLRGVTALRRKGRLEDWREAGTDKPAVQSLEELEFVRTIEIPDEHRAVAYPSYFRAGTRALKVAVSLPLRRRRIALDQAGHFFYPLQTPQSRTGSVIQVSAPFKLDNDRSSLLANDWNEWLQDEAARLTKDLIDEVWFEDFGADAYLALDSAGQAAPERYHQRVLQILKEEPVWPTMEVGRQRTFAKASALVIAADPLLAGFLSESQYLAPPLLKIPRVAAMARTAGALLFTVNSLVALRCAPSGGKLTTILIPGVEATHRYVDYVASASDPETQKRSALALSGLRRHLSKANKHDLETTPSTLAADGALKPARSLIRVEASNWDDCPEPMSSRLHRSLNDATAVARYSKNFDLSRWVTNACERARAGVVDDRERRAVYNWLLQKDSKLTPSLVALIRRSPVVRARDGAWVAPIELAMLSPKDAATLKAVVPAPSVELARRPELLTRLAVRRKVAATDVEALARRVVSEPERAEDFEDLLARHLELHRPSLFKTLAVVPCLRSRAGLIERPVDLHLPSPSNIEWLNDEAQIVAGTALTLYRRLGCLPEPKAETLLSALAIRRNDGRPPPRLEDFYPALVDALYAEGSPTVAWAEQPIIWHNGAYHAPQDCLVLAAPSRLFAAVLPVFKGPEAVGRAWEALGAASVAKSRHWLALFRWFDERAKTAGGQLGASERALLREAYRRQLFQPALEPPTDLKFLLGADARLYGLVDLTNGRLVENDYPPLAEALTAAGAAIAFGDSHEDSRGFLRRFNVRRLTEIAGTPGVELGPAKTPAPWLPRAQETRIRLMRSDHFAVALAELSFAQARFDSAFRSASTTRIGQRLRAITGIDIVTSIQRTFRLAGKTVRIQADTALVKGRIAMVAPRSAVDFDQMFAAVLAELVGAVQLTEIRRLAPSIGALLQCRSAADFCSFLLRQGIPIPSPLRGTDTSSQEDLFDGDDRLEEAFRDIMGDLNTHPSPRPAFPSAPPAAPPPPAPTTAPPIIPPKPLPALDTVDVTVVEASGAAAPSPPSSSRSGTWSGSGSWRPPTPEEAARDRLVGTRGEELVYGLEVARVRGLGYDEPEKVVIWRSRSSPGADHDIQSVDESGNVLWIEVKATTGRDGQFDWSRAEYELAMREGAQYELVRVYEADSLRPTVKRFRNPAALYGKGLRLELNTLRAFVESKA